MVSDPGQRDAAIEVDGIVTRFGRQTVHDNVSFRIEHGGSVAVTDSTLNGRDWMKDVWPSAVSSRLCCRFPAFHARWIVSLCCGF